MFAPTLQETKDGAPSGDDAAVKRGELSDHRCEITPPDCFRTAGRSKFEQKRFRKFCAIRRVVLRVPELRPTFSGMGGLESDQWKAPAP